MDSIRSFQSRQSSGNTERLTPATDQANSATISTPAQEMSSTGSGMPPRLGRSTFLWQIGMPDATAPGRSTTSSQATANAPRGRTIRFADEVSHNAYQSSTAALPSPLFAEAALRTELPEIKRWADSAAALGASIGEALTPAERRIARMVGVRNTDAVRVVWGYLPKPEEGSEHFMRMIGILFGDGLNGLALGHCIFLPSQDAVDDESLAHELRHVKQFEDFGSIDAFIEAYADQVNRYGYENSGLEQDARSTAAPFGK